MVVGVESLKGSINQLLQAAVSGPPQPIGIDIQLSDYAGYYKDGQPVKGNILLHTATGKIPDATTGGWAVNIELTGQMKIDSYKNPINTKFCYVQKSLPCLVGQPIPFLFKAPDLTYNSYDGHRARIGYAIRCTVTKEGSNVASKEQDLRVVNSNIPPPSRPLHIDVGIDDCLHIDLRLDSNTIDLNKHILGNVLFTIVRLAIKHMELNILRTEIVGGSVTEHPIDITRNEAKVEHGLTQDSQVVFRYELMDGTPAKSDIIPVRVSLRNVSVGPTMVNVMQNLTIRYYLSVVIIDENERRYFKKQEIFFYRSEDPPPTTMLAFDTPQGSSFNVL